MYAVCTFTIIHLHSLPETFRLFLNKLNGSRFSCGSKSGIINFVDYQLLKCSSCWMLPPTCHRLASTSHTMESFKTWWNVCWGSQAAGANPQRTSHIILIQRRIDFKKTARDALEANWCGKHCRSTILRELAAFSVSRKFESLFSTPPCSLHPPCSLKSLNMWHPSKASEESGGKRRNVCCWSAKRVCSPQAILTREDATALAKN